MARNQPNPLSWMALLTCVGGAAWLTGCGTQRTAAPVSTTQGPPNTSRPMVLWSGAQSGDLYWNGRITASDGRRWDVGFLPGIAPTGQVVLDSWGRSGDYYAFFFPEKADTNPARQCWKFTSKTMVKEFLVDGIADDAGEAKANIASAYHEKPFGWPASVVYYALKGYVVMPVGRLLVGTVGTAAGATGTAVCGAGQGVFPTVIAAGDIALVGTVYPAGRLLWHQPAWALSIFSAEPLPEHNGRWTLRIVSDPTSPGSLPPSPVPATEGNPSPPPQPPSTAPAPIEKTPSVPTA